MYDPSLPLPSKILIGPLMRPFLLGDWLNHPDIMPFYDPVGVAGYNAAVMEPEHYRFPAHCLQLDLMTGARLADLWASLPAGFEPDVLIWWGFFFPLPADIANCPVPSILIVADWQTCLDSVQDYLGAFDYVLADRALLRLKPERPHHYWPAYASSFAPPPPAPQRDIDICFVGNLNPAQYRMRNHYLARLAQMAEKHQLMIGQRLYNQECAELFARSKIVFNHSLRQEMNMRAYEAASAGALLLQEAGNLELEAFLPAGIACVTYRSDNLEALVSHYLQDDTARERIAAEGRARIQQHTFTSQFSILLAQLPDILSTIQAAGPRPGLPKGVVLQRIMARHLSRIFLPEPLARAAHILETKSEDAQAADADFHARSVCLAHAAISAGQTTLSQAQTMLFQLVQTRPEPIPLLNLAWICWFGQQTAPIAALLGRAMVQLCDPEFVSTSLAEFGDFVLPMGFCSFALEWERQAELPPLARWPARQRLLIWNGLLLQSQLCARQNPALALPYIESACGLLPELPDAWLLAAQFRLALDQPAAAARDLNQGLTCGGLFPWVYQALIRLALNRQDLIEARQLLAAARTLFHGPGTESVRAQLDALGLELSLAQNPRAGFA